MMGKYDKLIKKILLGRSDTNISFDELAVRKQCQKLSGQTN